MKTKEINETEGKTVTEQLREIRDKINLDIKDMTPEQMKEYFNNQKTLHPTAVTVAQLLHKLLKSEKPQKQTSLQRFRRGLVFQSSLGR